MYADSDHYRDPFDSDSRLVRLVEQGEFHALAIGASRNGVPIDMAPVASGLKSVNDQIEAILARDFPETFAEIQREAAEERAEAYRKNQALLCEIDEQRRARDHRYSYLLAG